MSSLGPIPGSSPSFHPSALSGTDAMGAQHAVGGATTSVGGVGTPAGAVNLSQSAAAKTATAHLLSQVAEKAAEPKSHRIGHLAEKVVGVTGMVSENMDNLMEMMAGETDSTSATEVAHKVAEGFEHAANAVATVAAVAAVFTGVREIQEGQEVVHQTRATVADAARKGADANTMAGIRQAARDVVATTRLNQVKAALEVTRAAVTLAHSSAEVAVQAASTGSTVATQATAASHVLSVAGGFVTGLISGVSLGGNIATVVKSSVKINQMQSAQKKVQAELVELQKEASKLLENHVPGQDAIKDQAIEENMHLQNQLKIESSRVDSAVKMLKKGRDIAIATGVKNALMATSSALSVAMTFGAPVLAATPIVGWALLGAGVLMGIGLGIYCAIQNRKAEQAASQRAQLFKTSADLNGMVKEFQNTIQKMMSETKAPDFKTLTVAEVKEHFQLLSEKADAKSKAVTALINNPPKDPGELKDTVDRLADEAATLEQQLQFFSRFTAALDAAGVDDSMKVADITDHLNAKVNVAANLGLEAGKLKGLGEVVRAMPDAFAGSKFMGVDMSLLMQLKGGEKLAQRWVTSLSPRSA
ncbi:MAG: hypothetical protein AB7F28_07555 [Candidatus Margulisiibacteriota bacterium]